MPTSDNKNVSAEKAGTLKLGDFTVNRMGFGAMRITGEGIWGPPDDEEAAKRVLQRAVELDVNFIDTADAYGPETSENLIREALHPYEGIIIATKGGKLRPGPGIWHNDCSPEHLREACETSLKRLGIERIELYQLHAVDDKVDYAKSIKALIDLKNEGKIRHIGISNVTLEYLKQALKMTPVVSVQNHYNFEYRKESEEVLNYCEGQSIAFIPYFPIGGGMRDFSQQTLSDIARQHGATERQVALAWLLQRSPVMLPIPGTSSIEHLEENIAAASLELTEADVATLNKLSDL